MRYLDEIPRGLHRYLDEIPRGLPRQVFRSGKMGGEHHGDKNEHEQERQQDQDPGHGFVPGFAHHVKEPRPEQNVDDFKREHHRHAGALAAVRPDAIHAVAAHVLEREHDDGYRREQKIQHGWSA